MAKKEKKVKQTMEAGYVPFTRDDINLEDGRNTRAEELFIEMLNVPKRVVKKKKKGKEDNIVEDDFYPTSMDEVRRMDELMVQVESAIDDPSDRELIENITYMKNVLAWSKTRQWNFAWWVVLVLAAYALVMFIVGGQDSKRAREVMNKPVSEIQTQYDAYVQDSQSQVADFEAQVAQATDKAAKKDASKSLKAAQKRLDKITKGGPKEYLKIQARPYRTAAKEMNAVGFWCLIWIALYLIAERPYGYMISKRRLEAKIYSGMRKVVFWIAGIFTGMAGALQVTETVTTWSDGSKTSDNDAMPIYFLKILFLLIAAFIMLAAAWIAVVVSTIMGFIRNYDLIGMAKQGVKKGKELTQKQLSV